MTDPKRKYYEKRANVLIKNLHSRHFEACYCADKAEALKKALEWIPAGSSVGWGGAMSAQQIYKHKSFNLSKTQEDPE